MSKKIIISLLIILLLVVTVIILKLTPPPLVVETPKKVKYSFILQNKTNKVINNGMVWAYAPVYKTSFQTCSQIKANLSYKLIKDESLNQILQFAIQDVPPFASRKISIEADLLYRSSPEKMALPDKHLYISPEKNIESNHPQIIALAKDLKMKKPLATAEKIYEWVSNNIKYSGYIKNSRGALYALKHKKGDCTEFMSLFIALCRANNIPARGVGGYICKDNCILKPIGYHNWAEFYHKGSWMLADCQKKQFLGDASEYIATQIICQDNNTPMGRYNRFRCQGKGLTIKMN